MKRPKSYVYLASQGSALLPAAGDRKSSSKWLQKQDTSLAHVLEIRSGQLAGWTSSSSGTSLFLPFLSALHTQLHPSPGSPLFLRQLSGATWPSAPSQNFHRPSSHPLFESHWPKMGCLLVLNQSQVRLSGLFPAQSSLPLESRSRPNLLADLPWRWRGCLLQSHRGQRSEVSSGQCPTGNTEPFSTLSLWKDAFRAPHHPFILSFIQ